MRISIEKLGLEVIGGQIVTRLAADKNKEESGDVIGTIVPKTIKNGKISKPDIAHNEYKSQPDSKKITKEGDLVLKLTQPLGACLIDKECEGLVVSSFCAIIRGFENTGIDSAYLAAYLNSDIGMQRIVSMMGGSTIQTISIGSLKALQIPCPPLAKQREIASVYKKRIELEELANRLVSLHQEKIDSLVSMLEE